MVANQVSKAPIAHVRIDQIAVGPRLRTKIGSVVGLKKSIDELGLIHPIVVTEAKELTKSYGKRYLLCAGERRIRAHTLLKRNSISARIVDLDGAYEVLLIEQDENEQREDLDAYSASQPRFDEVEQAYNDLLAEEKRALAAKGRTGTGVSKSTQQRLRGKARALVGVHPSTALRDSNIVAAVKKYPELERWPRRPMLKAEEALDELPRIERKEARIFLATFEPRSANEGAEAITNLVEWPEPLRRKVFKVAKKDPGHAQSAALGLPPVPDGRFIQVGIIMKDLQKVTTQYRQRDEASLEMRDALGHLKTAHTMLKRAYELKRAEFETMITD